MDVQILTLLGCPIGKVILSGGNFIWAHSPLEGQSLDWAGILMCAQHVIYAGQSWVYLLSEPTLYRLSMGGRGVAR